MINPIFYKDVYKADHRRQYPEKTQLIYSNFTPRISRVDGIDSVVVFGIQFFVKEFLINRFNEEFFNKPKVQILKDYKRRIDGILGLNSVGTDHIEALHDLGFLPLVIKALPEGTICPLRVPVLTIYNTLPEFYWLTNFLETLLSNSLWHPITTATIAYAYRKVLDSYAKETSDQPEFVNWQGHDFSMRGQSSLDSSMIGSMGHLLSFAGTDTIPAIEMLEKYYNADCEKELIGGSVPATEHSVMCMGGKETEKETYQRLLTKVYPSGVVSIVSDTWDYWFTLDSTIRELSPQIMARDGKFVVRPDSGDPVKIICGDPESGDERARKGTVEILWEIFGGIINFKGYRELESHIGCIYGDSITMDRCQEICKQLKAKGFSSTNCVFGIGSYTYQYVTRDTFGFAMKSTYGVIDGKPVEIFKDPLTDGGVKKSAKGLLRVNEDLSLSECVTWEEEEAGRLQTVFSNGKLVRDESFSKIRARLRGRQ